MKVLGIIFDENMCWRHHVDYAIKKTKQSIYGLKRLSNFLTFDEMAKVANACVFAKLYYGASVFLGPDLSGKIYRRLTTVSANVIKTTNKLSAWNLVSYKDIHHISNVLLPRQISLYTQGLLLFDTLKEFYGVVPKTKLRKNLIFEQRMNRFYYTKSNKKKVGLQLLENSLRSISPHINVDWLQLSRQNFKREMKTVIQNKKLGTQ